MRIFPDGLLGLKLRSILAAAFSESFDKVLAECLDVRVLFLELVDRDSIWDGLDEPSSWTSGNDVERC